jgi:hypothetical protein
MHGAVLTAVSVNVAVAIGAMAAHVLNPEAPRPIAAMTANSARESIIGMRPVLLLAALGGFISLSYEIFLFRTVSYASGSSAKAFAVTLACFLVGIAGGARGAGKACEMLPQTDAMRKASDELVFANLIGLLFLPLMAHLAWLGAAGDRCCRISPNSASRPTTAPECKPACFISPTSLAPRRAPF